MRASSVEIFAANLRALAVHAEMAHKDGRPNQSAIGAASKTDQRTIGRILALDMIPSLDLVEKIAGAFGMHPWQMLIPGIDPSNPPVVVMSEAERQFYRRLEELRTAEMPPQPYRTA